VPPDPAIVNYPMFKSAMLTMIANWPSPWANGRCYFWAKSPPVAPGEPPFPKSPYGMPWIAYLCAERAADVRPPADLLTERTPDGGLLMIAAETRFDPFDPTHRARSRLLAGIMMAHGGDPGR
jgi:hypothetical protein